MDGPKLWDVPQYYYCTRHDRVEPQQGCSNKYRLGPFDTEAAASRALELAHARNEQWDEEDRRWRGDDDDD